MIDNRTYLFAVLNLGQAVQKIVAAPWAYYSSALTLLTVALRVLVAPAEQQRKRR